MEKLVAKVKKLKQTQMDQDFPGIFNLQRKEDEKQHPFGNDLELKTYKEHINELYELLLRQNGNRIGNGKQDHEEQYLQIKSYLTLQAQMGALKKFRFDETYSDMLDLGELQKVLDIFTNKNTKSKNQLGEISSMNTKALYLNAEQQL